MIRDVIPLSDGEQLSVTLFIPDSTPAPCILEALPYRKDDMTSGWRPEYQRFCDEFGFVAQPDKMPNRFRQDHAIGRPFYGREWGVCLRIGEFCARGFERCGFIHGGLEIHIGRERAHME